MLYMKHHRENPHPSRGESLRSGESPRPLEGDVAPVKRDMSHEQKAGLKKPGKGDPRVAESEADQGRTS